MQKYVVWGTGNYAHKLIDNFLHLIDYIEVFLDHDLNKSNLEGISIVRPDDWGNYEDYIIVICVQNFFGEIYNELIHKHHVKKENIISAHEWICRLLSEGKVKLYPRSVRLEACTLCQLDCAYCYMRLENYSATGCGYLKFRNFEKFITENPQINQVEISNSGEVFLNPDLKEILLLADQKNIEITISGGANFNDVSDEILELLVKTQVSHITISIDGASQEKYSIYRRKGNFDKVISNIKKLNEYKEKHNSVYPILTWKYILMQHNECDVEKAAIMAKELNMRISYVFDCVKDEFMPQDKVKLEKVTGLKYFTRKEYNQKHWRQFGDQFCYQSIFNPQINYDGRLLGCCMIWREDYGINVFEQGLLNSLNSEGYLRMIRLLLGIEQPTEELGEIPCLHCVLWGRNYREKNHVYL